MPPLEAECMKLPSSLTSSSSSSLGFKATSQVPKLICMMGDDTSLRFLWPICRSSVSTRTGSYKKTKQSFIGINSLWKYRYPDGNNDSVPTISDAQNWNISQPISWNYSVIYGEFQYTFTWIIHDKVHQLPRLYQHPRRPCCHKNQGRSTSWTWNDPKSRYVDAPAVGWRATRPPIGVFRYISPELALDCSHGFPCLERAALAVVATGHSTSHVAQWSMQKDGLNGFNPWQLRLIFVWLKLNVFLPRAGVVFAGTGRFEWALQRKKRKQKI